MLWTLMQNTKLFNLANRQLESTINPVLTPQMFGTTIRLTNDGSIDIKQIYKTAVIGGWFDSNKNKILGYQISRMYQPVKESLSPGESFDIDVTAHLIPIPTGQAKNLEAGMNIYGIVLVYRRSADMKPFVKFLPFIAESLPGKDVKTEKANFAMPLFPSYGSSEAGPSDKIYSRWVEDARAELLTLYKEKVAPVEIQ